MAKENIARQVADLLRPTITGMGYSLWDVTYTKEGADWHLEITIDKPEGITIDDCEAVHRAVDPLLDEADPIEEAYHLDVSSPGIERELRTDEHIAASIGEVCEVKLFAPLDGSRTWKGTLAGYENGVLRLETPKGTKEIGRAAASKIKTVYFD